MSARCEVDPQWRQANGIHLAARETKTQAMIGLLPIDVSRQQGLAGTRQPYRSPPRRTAAVNLSVNLFSWNNWVALKAADATVAQAEANYQAAAQSLVQRVTGSISRCSRPRNCSPPSRGRSNRCRTSSIRPNSAIGRPDRLIDVETTRA